MTSPRHSHHRIYAGLLSVVGVLIVLQGLWAGVFIREGQDFNDTWVTVHARGADLTILLSLIATVLAVRWFRQRRELLIGTVTLTALLAFEAYLGGLIGTSPAVEAVHFPIALALVALAVWLPLHARRLDRTPATVTRAAAEPAPQRR